MTEKDDRLVLRDALMKGVAQRRQKVWEEAVKKALVSYGNGNMEIGIERIARKMIELADMGERWAIEEIGNRLDGRPSQAHTLAGDPDGEPVKFIGRVERVIVDADPKT